jgi:2,4-dienoyl-CoA reductase (NADPH2)
LSASTTLAERGHEVHLFEANNELGGQLNLAKQVPGKEEFHETLRYWKRQTESNGVSVHLGRRVSAEDLLAGRYDEVIIATGVLPRDPGIPGQSHPMVKSYIEVLRGAAVGQRVLVIGAGGIGFDVAEFLVSSGHSTTLDLPAWLAEWGVTDPALARGGLATLPPVLPVPARQVMLLQRKTGKLGAGLGKTTGWIHRASLKNLGVRMIGGVNYEQIGDQGLQVSEGEERANLRWLAADTIVLCAGQVPLRELQAPLLAAGMKVHVIGGAFEAGELDAKRAIDQGVRLGALI